LARTLFTTGNMKRPISRWRGAIRRFAAAQSAALLVALLACSPALAQRLPQEGGVSWWAEGGFVKPAHAAATAGASAGLDYFISRSFSVGFAGGFWRANSTGGTAKEAYLDAVATKNWDFQRFHPFFQGGVGLYHVGFPSASANKLGGFGGGGVDIFFTRASAIELTARYHWTPDVGGRHAGFFEGVGGVKFYF
jgi:hypothetical protein